jgi:hypothetical protein
MSTAHKQRIPRKKNDGTVLKEENLKAPMDYSHHSLMHDIQNLVKLNNKKITTMYAS